VKWWHTEAGGTDFLGVSNLAEAIPLRLRVVATVAAAGVAAVVSDSPLLSVSSENFGRFVSFLELLFEANNNPTNNMIIVDCWQVSHFVLKRTHLPYGRGCSVVVMNRWF
jgi:hypothetical protein